MVGGGVGTVLTAGYLLWTVQRVAQGMPPEKLHPHAHVVDVQPLEWYAWAPLLVLILAAGLYPRLLLDVTDGAVAAIAHAFGG
jgi:NADH-quinone oxidoreductase subunit M